MPIRIRRKTTTRPRRRVYRRRGMAYRPRAMIRYNKVPSFIETFHAQDVSTQNAGGVMTLSFSSIPQYQQYAELYKQYRINWVRVTIVPDFNSYQAAAGGPNAPRLVYAQSDTVNPTAPIQESDVLTDNGCKIRSLVRPVSFTFKPVPWLYQQLAGGANVGVNKKMQWIDTAESAVPHGGTIFWITGAAAPGAVARVYYKVSFSLKDGN